MPINWIRISFYYLILVGILGLLLRYLFIDSIPGLNFGYLLHAHSHLAMLGWVFNMLFIAMVSAFIPEKVKSYKLLFILLQISVLGMLFSFPFQGYAAISISFSSFHIFLSWWFAFKFYRDSNETVSLALSLVRWSLFFMIISSIGPFGLGASMSQGLAGTDLYQLFIYFYLHFQYNAWFSLAIFGLFFHWLQQYQIQFSMKDAMKFKNSMIISCFLSYSLSTLWMQPDTWVYGIGFISAILLLISLVYFIIILKQSKIALQKHFTKAVWNLLGFSFFAFCIKILLQAASAFPYVADLAYKARNFTIGYLHIVFLGFVSVFLIAYYLHSQEKPISKNAIRAIWLFLWGFIISEIVIFLQPSIILFGFGIFPYGNEMLFAISSLMPLGILYFCYHANLLSFKQA